ncbi:MAG: hypothetical protein AAGC55_00430, partial [Myxococcota bacterium]
VFVPEPELPLQRSLELVDTGAAPRRLLTYNLPETAMAREFAISTENRVREYAGGSWSPQITLPATRYGLAILPAKTQDRGSQAFSYQIRGLAATIAEPDGDDPRQAKRIARMAEQLMARYREQVERRRVTAVVGRRGRVGPVSLSPDLEARPEGELTARAIQQLLIESVVPWPDRPVGVGARWTAITVLYRDAVVVTQRAEYRLLAIEDSGVRLAATIAQVGESQQVTGPTMPRSVNAELVALSWKAEGELTVDLTSPTPIAGQLTVDYRVHGRLTDRRGSKEHFLESQGTVTLSSTAVADTPAP